MWEEEIELREDVRDKNGELVLDIKTGKPIFRVVKRRFDAAASSAGSVLESSFGLEWTEKHLDEIARGERIAKAILAKEHEARTKPKDEDAKSKQSANGKLAIPTPGDLH